MNNESSSFSTAKLLKSTIKREANDGKMNVLIFFSSEKLNISNIFPIFGLVKLKQTMKGDFYYGKKENHQT